MLLRPRQKTFVERSVRALDDHGNTLGVAPTGCHAPGTPIIMFDGAIKAVENIQAGDRLLGPDSRPRTVIELHHGMDDMYQIRPLKGKPFTVNAGHILSLVKTNQYSDLRRQWGTPAGSIVNLSVVNYLARSASFKHLHKLYRVGCDFPVTAEPVLDPYFLGLLLGDGSLKYGSPAITTMDFEVVAYCHAMAEQLGVGIREDQLVGNEANTYHFRIPGNQQENPLTARLRALGVCGCGADEKFIPPDYKVGSRETRTAILAGLIDTDGYLIKNCIEFSSASRQLAEDVAFIARSLGFQAFPKPKRVNGKTYHRFVISGDFSDIPIRVARRKPGARRQKKSPLRTGFTVHAMGPGEYFGFTVDGDHLYLMGDFTVTHNSGKTIMLSGVIGRMLDGNDAKASVLAHRDELTAQNVLKFAKVNPAISTSIVDSRTKSWRGRTTFAMVPTLSRQKNLDAMPALDLLVIDEAHHVAADSYRRIIDQARNRNPDVRVFGVTATPNRGDKKGLRPVFSNVADQISIGELITSGHLVPPRTFVIDVGAQEALKSVRKTIDDFDMKAVDAIMNTAPITEAVIRHWREKAGDRQTVVFCSTVDHARNVRAAFVADGVQANMIYGDMGEAERRSVLRAFEKGDIQVIVNVAVSTEGWDHQPIGCVVLLRPSSYKSTMIQMIGRGLRTVDPNEFPGLVKTDCIVLDFGTSTLLHGCLEQDVNLDGKTGTGEAPTKDCPECGAVVPLGVRECPLCGYLWENTGAGESDAIPLSDFVMSEIDLLKRSSFRWFDLFGDDAALVANGFNAWGGIFFLHGRWHAIGGAKGQRSRLLSVGERTVCLAAADDWLNENETDESAHKTRSWLNQPATERQLRYLPATYRQDFGLTRYQASALLTFTFNKAGIQQLVMASASSDRRAA
jgi:superfamily II DNA or RNA helicase